MNKLSVEVLKHSILPFLDWNSRLNLNIALPFEKRVLTRFSKSEVYTHDRLCIIQCLKEKLELISECVYPKSVLLIREIFLMIIRPRYRFFIESIEAIPLRNNFIDKLNMYRSGSKIRLDHNFISIDEAMEIAKIARTVKKILLERPKWLRNNNCEYIKNTTEDWCIIKY